jgi:hypothetical protein
LGVDDDRRHLAEVANQLHEFFDFASIVPAQLTAVGRDAVDRQRLPFI